MSWEGQWCLYITLIPLLCGTEWTVVAQVIKNPVYPVTLFWQIVQRTDIRENLDPQHLAPTCSGPPTGQLPAYHQGWQGRRLSLTQSLWGPLPASYGGPSKLLNPFLVRFIVLSGVYGLSGHAKVWGRTFSSTYYDRQRCKLLDMYTHASTEMEGHHLLHWDFSTYTGESIKVLDSSSVG